ncbi:hypothetical protein P4I85_34445 [Bacillus cereus]|nr:hypothetical protein [Bacillus cereus]
MLILSYYYKNFRGDEKSNNVDLFYILCFVGLAFLVIVYAFYLPVKEVEEKQTNNNILIVQQLIEKKLSVEKENFDIELKKEKYNLFNDNWISNELKCIIYTNGKRFEVSFIMKQIEDYEMFEPIDIDKIVER